MPHEFAPTRRHELSTHPASSRTFSKKRGRTNATATRPLRAYRSANRSRCSGIVKRAAEIQGRSVSEFVVSAAREAANRTIEEASVIRLTLAGQRAFAEAILNPPNPSAGLERAFASHELLIREMR
jgi:uncharacterized protein (DUF1778 family)